MGLKGRSVCKMPSEGCWCVQTALLLFDFEVQPGDVPLFEVAEGFIEVADGRRMVADDDDFRAFHFGALDQIRQLVEELGVQAEIAAEVGFGGGRPYSVHLSLWLKMSDSG